MARYSALSKLLHEAGDYAGDLATLDALGALDDGQYARHLDGRLNALLRRIAINRDAEFIANDTVRLLRREPEEAMEP